MSAARQLELLHRVSRARALREVLADGAWHTSTELARRVGHRFGAAILSLRRGDDGGPPLLIRKQKIREDGSLWAYWSEGVNPSPPRPEETWKAKAQRLQAENRRLLALLHQHGVEASSHG